MPVQILVVDDDPGVLSGVTLLLEQAGYSTYGAATGTEALALLAQPVQLIVLDVMLPDIDGLTLCRRIRELTTYIPILMLSACDKADDQVAGLDLGADEYVTKPFEPRVLLARVQAMLRFAGRPTAQGVNEPPLMYGPLRLWPAQHRVEINAVPIELSPKEWALLELLMRHPGQVFGRQTLLRRIWGDEFLDDSRTVDVHVQRLRSKLGTDAADTIQTVRGFGYRFVPPETQEQPIRSSSWN